MSKQSKEEKRMNIIAQNGNDGLHYSLGVREDSIVEGVRKDLLERSKIGQEEYGTTLDREDLSDLDWHQQHYEELLDAALYVKKKIIKLNKQ